MISEQPIIRRIGVGLAALGRPAYINLGRDGALPAERSVKEMRQACWDVLDAAYAAGVRWVDLARSYGRSEEFLAGWLSDRGHADVTVSSKWGYAYVGGWRTDAEVHEVKEHSLARFREQWAQTHDLLGDQVGFYQVHSLTADSPLFEDTALLAAMAELRADGIGLGFSTSGPAQDEAVWRALELEVDGRRLFDAVQSTWNLLEPSVGEALAEVHRAGLHVLVKESLANGRLAVRPSELVARLAERIGTGPDAIATAAVLTLPWVDTVLVGPASVEQLRSNLRALDVAFHPGELLQLGALTEDPVKYWRHRSTLPWT